MSDARCASSTIVANSPPASRSETSAFASSSETDAIICSPIRTAPSSSIAVRAWLRFTWGGSTSTPRRCASRTSDEGG